MKKSKNHSTGAPSPTASTPAPVSEPDITLVINYRNKVADSATLPIMWYFSERLVEQGPKYLILIDENQNEIGHHNLGRRWLVKIEKAIKFIQFKRSGNHCLSVLAFSEHDEALDYLKKSNRHEYEYHVDARLIDKYGTIDSCLAAATINVNIPAELFAQPPKSKFGKLIFAYLKWPRHGLTDECDTKKQRLLALPKLPIFLAWWAIKIILFIIYLAYMLVAPPISAFFGYSPVGFRRWRQMILDALNWDVETDIRVYGSNTEYLRLYHEVGRPGFEDYKEGKRLFFSPAVILLNIILLGYVIYTSTIAFTSGSLMVVLFFIILLFGLSLHSHFKRFGQKYRDNNKHLGIIISSWLLIVFGLSLTFLAKNGLFMTGSSGANTIKAIFWALGVVLLFIIIVLTYGAVSKFFGTGHKTKFTKADKEADRENRYRKYLLLNFTKPKPKVDLDNLPKSFDGNETIKKISISFWALKAKVCRPYER